MTAVLNSTDRRRTPNEQQVAAIEARGQVFVSAGAGTGKTTVLVERFVEAVCERGIDVESLLVITYTERAAAELASRIRARLDELGRHELARALDGAWISTIHGFCLRLLKAHPFAAGVDPRFRILDESQGRVIRSESFETALTEFCGTEQPERLQLLATYGAAGLRRMLTSVYETLRSAGRDLELDLGERPGLQARLAELAETARGLAADAGATDAARATASQALALTDGAQPTERLLDLRGLRARGERAAAYEEARKAVQQAALDELALRDRELLQELLHRFAETYAAAKDGESALDFEDLQLRARDLLRDDPVLREREQLRFRALMVDEFQDTNRLQCELVDLLTGSDTECFFVGDEFQSIYGFRHADVQVFRERRADAETLLPLTRNYRSRPEVLSVVNHLFAAEFGGDFQPLAASGEFPDPVFGVPVELLVTDKSAYSEGAVHWRRAEARHVAGRVRELVDSGAAAPGEIVLLFAAGTDAEWYEEELREVGLPTYRATGRGYFGQQQVVDLLSYLRLLHNRYDDDALVSVLASPFVGVSNDTLLLLRRAAGRRPIFTGLERTFPTDLPDDDERLLRAFRQRLDRLVEASTRLSLERLCERIVADHDYDLAVLAHPDGRRRYANLRKLARLARSYEALRGPDVEGFVRFVAEQDAVGTVERDAVAEEEDADAVRLLTIHGAKGLEFKVVVVADAGRDRAAPSVDEILCLTDGRFGFRVADPVTGKRHGAFGYADVTAARKREENAERLRLYYVAMTRAIDRLIVSGSIDLAQAGLSLDDKTPIGWVLARLDCAGELARVGRAPVELERERGRLLLRIDRGAAETIPPQVDAAHQQDGQLLLFGREDVPLLPAPAPVLVPIPALPDAPLHDVRRLSFSALALFDRCSYRYYAERVAGMRPVDARGGIPGATGLAATEVGDAVHRLLELVDLAAPALPDLQQVRTWYPAVTEEELARIAGFVECYCGSELARRVSALSGAQPERPFAFEHDGVLLHGRLDVLYRDGPRALVLDYKTNSLAEGTSQQLVEADYRLQRVVYAIACFRAGAEEVEVVYHFLEQTDAVVSRTFTRAELPQLELELSDAIVRIRAGEFRPTPSEFVCAGCPALDVVCAGPRLRGIAA